MTEQEWAAHFVAKQMRRIAEYLPKLTPEQRKMVHMTDQQFVGAAMSLEASSPFTPLTVSEAIQLVSELYDEMRDLNGREVYEAITQDWTDADYRAEFDERQESPDESD